MTGWLVGKDLLTLPVLAAIAGGNLPDVLHQLWDLSPMGRRRLAWATPLFTFHDNLQLETSYVLKGIVAQVILVVVAIILVLLQPGL